MSSLIGKLKANDFQTIYTIINEAATAYNGKIPVDCYNQPYMSKEELKQEIESGVQFYGYRIDGFVVTVMGIQQVDDVTLIRHAYTLTSHQHRGNGTVLLNHLLSLAETLSVLVGTWVDATWAIKFYQNHGFKLATRQETKKLLHHYWNISERQVETSVVLQLQRATQ